MIARAGVAALLLLLSVGCTTKQELRPAEEPTATGPSSPVVDGGEDSGRSGERTEGGPLRTDTSGEACSWNPSRTFVYGDDMLETTEPIEIESVELLHQRGVEVVSAWTMPTGDVPFSGTWVRWPLPKSDLGGDNGLQWDERQQAVGADLDPGRTYNLLLHLERAARPEKQGFDGVRIRYRTSDGSYVTDSKVRVSFRSRQKDCP